MKTCKLGKGICSKERMDGKRYLHWINHIRQMPRSHHHKQGAKKIILHTIYVRRRGTSSARHLHDESKRIRNATTSCVIRKEEGIRSRQKIGLHGLNQDSEPEVQFSSEP